MDTTIVLSMRSLTTLPTRIFLRLRAVFSVVAVVSVVMSSPGRAASLRGRALLLLQHREKTRHFPTALADLQRVVQLLHGVTEAEVEQVLAQLGDASVDLVRVHFPVSGRLHVGHVSSLPARCARGSACGSAASRRRGRTPREPARARCLRSRTARGPA